MHQHRSFFIGGEWIAPAGRDVIKVISPHTEQVIGEVPDGTPTDIDRAVAAARRAFDSGPWPHLSFADRAEMVAKLGSLYEASAESMAQLITAQMGSPISFSRLVQAPAPARMLKYFSELGRTFQPEEQRPGQLGPITVRREPIGVVAAIMPWNVPQFTLMSKLAPALVAGCTVVIKPAPETPLDTYLLADLVAQAGIPAGVVNVVAGGREVGAHLVAHPGVDKVSFTGSTEAGRRIGAVCGEQLKKCSLELGGKAAAIILDDVDLGQVMYWLQVSTMMNNGQACIAQSRILASRKRYAEVVEALAAMAGSLPIGDPADEGTAMGPVVSRRQQERIQGYIRLGQQEGAKLVVGGPDRPRDVGWYVAPTVFSGVTNSMRIAREEIFGPVLSVIPYEDEADAIRIANDSEYGLCGSVWTADSAHGVDVARKVRVGTFGVNMYIPEINAPFGGMKQSGIGRELGPEGFGSYLDYKSIVAMG
ncbi:MAG: aldehyde dehydrogenase [Polyangiaceae bacterium]